MWEVKLLTYTSRVMIQCEDKAFDLFRQLWREFNESPNHVYSFYNEHTQVFCFLWDNIHWDVSYTSIKIFNNLMQELSKDEYRTVIGYGFKCLQIREDYSLQKISNFRGDFVFPDFQINIDFTFPQKYKQTENNNLL